MTNEPCKQRSVLVLGASRGIGRAVCRRLLQEGFQVIGVARRFAKEDQALAHFHPVPLDLADLDRLPTRLHELQAAYPCIDTLVCCAGRGQFGCLEEFSYAQMRELMELNFLSHAFAARAFLPALKRKGRGLILFIGSEAALAGRQKGALYCASKFALRGLAQALREECARSGVQVSIINPGMVKTDFFADLDFAPGEDEANYLLPEDVAEAVSLLVEARPGVVLDEINLSPLKKVVAFKKKRGSVGHEA